MTLLGFKDETKHFKYRATISDGNVDGEERIFFGQVRSLDENPEEIIKNQHGLVVGQATCRNFRSSTNVVTYVIELRNLKEEAKDEDDESGISDND